MKTAPAIFVIAGLSAAILAKSPTQTYSVKMGLNAPSGEIAVATPLIRWEVSSQEGLAITASSISLNGTSCPATYNADTKAVEYRPSKPLASGSYKVEAKVTLAGKATYKKAWDFTVGANPIAIQTEITPLQTDLLTIVNAIRAKLKLPEAKLDETLTTAAALHAQYLLTNGEKGHIQTPGKPGFFGANHTERLAKLGFTDPGLEEVKEDAKVPVDAAVSMYNTVYHRLPFLAPGPIKFGAGQAGTNLTMLFTYGDQEGVVVSPADGQVDVPLTGDVTELPSPLRMHAGAKSPVGFAVVVNVAQQNGSGFQEISATLATGGVAVPTLLNEPGNDDQLVSSIALIPTKPLKPNTVYMAKVWGKNANGDDFSREWSFTTVKG